MISYGCKLGICEILGDCDPLEPAFGCPLYASPLEIRQDPQADIGERFEVPDRANGTGKDDVHDVSNPVTDVCVSAVRHGSDHDEGALYGDRQSNHEVRM